VLSPYDIEESSERKFLKLSECKSYVLTNKWNGTNVMFYKYKSNDGNALPLIAFSYIFTGDWYVSVKPRMTPFLNDGPTGNFLTVIHKHLKLPVTLPLSNELPEILSKLVNTNNK
jgi:hypothetical protein